MFDRFYLYMNQISTFCYKSSSNFKYGWSQYKRESIYKEEISAELDFQVTSKVFYGSKNINHVLKIKDSLGAYVLINTSKMCCPYTR